MSLGLSRLPHHRLTTVRSHLSLPRLRVVPSLKPRLRVAPNIRPRNPLALVELLLPCQRLALLPINLQVHLRQTLMASLRSRCDNARLLSSNRLRRDLDTAEGPTAPREPSPRRSPLLKARQALSSLLVSDKDVPPLAAIAISEEARLPQIHLPRPALVVRRKLTPSLSHR